MCGLMIFIKFRKFSDTISSTIFSGLFSFSFFSWNSHYAYVGVLMMSHLFLRSCSRFYFFFLFLRLHSLYWSIFAGFFFSQLKSLLSFLCLVISLFSYKIFVFIIFISVVFVISISLPILCIWWDTVIIHSFNSLNMGFFSSLNN